MQLVEAGGYTNLNKQISQIEDCVAAGAQGVVIGAISYDGLNNLVTEIKGKNIPVIDVINGMSSHGYFRQVARLVRRDGLQGRRIHRQAASEGQRQGRRSPGSRARPAPAGSRPATPASSTR